MNAAEGIRDTIQKEMEKAVKADSDGQMRRLQDLVWNALVQQQGNLFYTAKGLDFTYRVKGNEIFVSRKAKSVTRMTVDIAVEKAVMLCRTGTEVKGPKKLGCFGASYLYPVFLKLGIFQR